MSIFDSNGFITSVLGQAGTLAESSFKGYAGAAETDVKAFLEAQKDEIARGALLFAEGKLDRQDVVDLIEGKKDLAEMHALKEAGLAEAALQTFLNQLIGIAVQAAFAAIKL